MYGIPDCTLHQPCVYVQAAARGLAEELGILCDPCMLQGPLTPNHARKLEVPGRFCDFEFVECYRHAPLLSLTRRTCSWCINLAINLCLTLKLDNHSIAGCACNVQAASI